MKYLSVELAAIDELVGNRFLQSVEFEQGKALASVLKAQITSVSLDQRIRFNKIGDGSFITLREIPRSGGRFVVFDLQQSAIFDQLSDSESLFVFQKVIRFAKKIWTGLALNFSERIIASSTKAVLFPFRGFRPTPFRITIEREPMAERLAKRGDKGNFLLIYKAGHEGSDGGKEAAELTNFKKCYESIPDLWAVLHAEKAAASATPEIDQLKVAELSDASGYHSSSIYRRFEDWLPILTTQQRKFVDTPIAGPHRIEGAAGTGKTLSLMLKAISALRSAKSRGETFHSVFVTHSDATKRSIAEILSVMDSESFSAADRALFPQSLKVCTLSELCAEQLRQSISESEFIDRDAMESKELQLLYISEALDEAMKSDFQAHERFLSSVFTSFLKSEDRWKIVEMLQHEISVLIKGRSSEDLDLYKKVKPLTYGLPIVNDADKGFTYAVFRVYQRRLGDVGQFDTDDVILTTIGQLDTPIWRRRRAREGYDALFIDETHLFNINELHLFHFFSKREGPYPIVYSVDRSQAVGDKGWTTDDIAESLNQNRTGDEAKIKTVFRSSPDIVNLAFAIVSSGATLFTNFDNPIDIAATAFTDQEEKLTSPPVYLTVPNEDALVESAFQRVEHLQQELGCRRSDILVVTLDENILKRMATFAAEKNRPHLILTKRGDVLAVEGARKSSQIILAHADYVGGLEFLAVVLVGIDGGRVPPTRADGEESSRNYLTYAAHNRLYVAVTRARYRVEFLGEKARGPSKILEPAIAAGVLAVKELSS